MGSRPYLKKELLPAIIEWKRNKRGMSFHTQITMNLADDKELIDLLYEAGFDWIFIGIETPNEESLAEWRELGDTWGLTAVLRAMAYLAVSERDVERGCGRAAQIESGMVDRPERRGDREKHEPA